MTNNVPQHKKKIKWEPITHTKALPLELLLPKDKRAKTHKRIKRYELLLKTIKYGEPYYVRMQVWSEHIRVAMRQLAKQEWSEREIHRMHGRFIDPML